MLGLFKVGSHLGKELFLQCVHTCAGPVCLRLVMLRCSLLRFLPQIRIRLDFGDKLADTLVIVLPVDFHGKYFMIVFDEQGDNLGGKKSAETLVENTFI